MDEKENKPDIEITELFVAKAGNDWHRTFVETIKRFSKLNGSKFVVGRIPVYENTIISKACDDKDLGRKLDEFVIRLLEYGIRNQTSHIIKILNKDISLN